MGLEAPQNSDPNLHFRSRAVHKKIDRHKEGNKGIVAAACARQFRSTDNSDDVEHSNGPVVWPSGPFPKATGMKVARRPDPKILALRHIPSQVQHAWEDLCRENSLSSNQSPGTGHQESKNPLFLNKDGPVEGHSEVLQKNRKSESGSDTATERPVGTLRHIVAHQLEWRQRLEEPENWETSPLLKLLPAMQDNPMFSDSSSPSSPSKAGAPSRSLPSRISGSITNKLFRIQGLSMNSAEQRADAAIARQGLSRGGPRGATRTRSRVSRIIARWEKGEKPQNSPGSESETEHSLRLPSAAKQPRRPLLSRFLQRTSSSGSESPAACLPHGRAAKLSRAQQTTDGQHGDKPAAGPRAHDRQAYSPSSQRSLGGNPRLVACQQAEESLLEDRVEAIAAQLKHEISALWEAQMAALQLTPHKDSGGGASTDSPSGNQQHVMELLRSILDTLRKQQSSIRGQEELLCELRDISSRAAKAAEVGAALEACLKRHGLLPERDRDEPRKAAGKVSRGEDEDDRRRKVQNEPPTSQQQEGLKDASLMGDDLGNSLDAWQMDVLHAETPVGLRGALQGEGMQGGYLPFSQARVVVPVKQSGGMSSSYDSPCYRAHHKIVSLELCAKATTSTYVPTQGAEDAPHLCMQNGALFDELFTSTSAASSIFSLPVTPQTVPPLTHEAATPSPERTGGGATGSPKPRKSWIGKILRRKRTGHKVDSSP